MLNYRANGKLLLTSEYAITQGAKGLAVPTRYGQTLNYRPNPADDYIRWEAKAHDGQLWFWAELDLGLNVVSTSHHGMATRLIDQLRVMQHRTALLDRPGIFTTELEFPSEWGLGSSSTLGSLLAQCTGTDPLTEFRKVHGGSGYDLACGTANGPIIYRLEDDQAIVEPTKINFEFTHDIGFVYSGKKQLTSESLQLVKEKPFSDTQIHRFNTLTDAFLASKTVLELEDVIVEHEALISEHFGLPKVKDTLFSGFHGQVKSLGGWGGDFVLITRLASSKKMLRTAGYKAIFPFKSLAL
ncbi:MAG: GYDIA family GHMP kinase [Schleiferiaceae bacterium]